ncbi:MAG: 30S ribosome-binding factor RbfA [Prolixibacteraceae bacterium]|nr:30S ribosome-binding factor RbfA [Prolixibacteraceae bacterium]
MDSTRQQKINRLLQKELATIFQQESKKLFGGKLISVTMVRITPDLSLARIHLSIFPSEHNNEIVKEIQEISPKIRGILGRRIGKQVRITPELQFFIDDSLDYIKHIDELLKS